MLPFGIQSTQIHVNYWDEKDFLIFQKFIKRNQDKIISADLAFSKNSDNYFHLFINFTLEKILKLKRLLF